MKRALIALYFLASLSAASAFGADSRYTLSEYSMNQCSGCIEAQKDVKELDAQGVAVRCVDVDADPAFKEEAERLRLSTFPAWRLVDADGAEIGRWLGAGKAAVILATIRARFPSEGDVPKVDDRRLAGAVDVDAAKTELNLLFASETKALAKELDRRAEDQRKRNARLVMHVVMALICFGALVAIKRR